MKRIAGPNKFTKTSQKNPIIAMCLEKPRKIVEISKELKIKRSTLAYYLNNLERKGFIKRERIQEKVTGRPTIVKVNKDMIAKIEEGYEGDNFFLELNTFKVLNAIKESKKPLDYSEVHKKANIDIELAYYLDKANEYGLIETKHSITKKGLTFLKKKRKYKTYEEIHEDE